MIHLYLASVLAALAAAPASPDGSGMEQASLAICRPGPESSQFSAPQCRGGGPLEAQPVCFCTGIYQKYEELACRRDGSPALFSAGHRLTALEQSKLVSCKDVERRNRR